MAKSATHLVFCAGTKKKKKKKKNQCIPEITTLYAWEVYTLKMDATYMYACEYKRRGRNNGVHFRDAFNGTSILELG